MDLAARYRVSFAIVAAAVLGCGGWLLFARPQYRPAHQGTTIHVPAKRPAADAAGAAGWVWPDGTPGWRPGQTIDGYPISGIQTIEAQPAQLAAARDMLDADRLGVVEAEHLAPGESPLAIFAAPMLYEQEHTVCLGAALPLSGTVQWLCPDKLAASPVLVAATLDHGALALVGVARGDVYRVVLHAPNAPRPFDWKLYDRGTTWGQFTANLTATHFTRPAVLRVYGKAHLLETLTLRLRSGQERVYP